MNEFSFFSHHRVNDHLYVIRESFGFDRRLPNSYFFMGVVIGGNKVAVIDAGNGATGGLRKYIETYITGKRPMINLLTHNHLDHIGACMMFDERYMHKDDINEDELEWATDLNRHYLDPKSDLAAFCQGNPDVMQFCAESYYKNQATAKDFTPITDGDVIDLGGIEIEVLHTPGHSRGSCCFYVRQDHFVFAGDAITPKGMGLSPFKVGDESETVHYLKRAKEKWPQDTLICDGHNFINGMILIDRLLDAFDEAIHGINLQDDIVAPPSPFIYDDGKHKRKKAPGEVRLRHFHKDVNVNYSAKLQS